MASQSSKAMNQKIIIIGLAVVIVLLAVVVTVLIINTSANKKATTAATTTSTTSTSGSSSNMSASTAMQNSLKNAGSFDKKTATKVTAGKTPKQWCEEYFKAILKKDWETAWNHMPAAKKNATTAKALGEQLSGYNLTGYSIDGVKESGDTTTVACTEKTGYGNFTINWTFVKDGNNWLVKDRAVAGMDSTN